MYHMTIISHKTQSKKSPWDTHCIAINTLIPSYPILSHHWGCIKPASVDGQDNQSTQAMFHIHPKLLIGILAPESHQEEPWLSD